MKDIITIFVIPFSLIPRTYNPQPPIALLRSPLNAIQSIS